ncbi:MAG: hypothetical protein ACO262_06365 [Vulcanococcus sp.]|jgi:hypothetical protein
MIATPRRRYASCSVGSAMLLVALAAQALVPASAQALPFDPLPSAFQAWLNARRDWPNNEQHRFQQLAECSDQTVATSPYRMAVFTCLAGIVTIRRPGAASQRCAIQRVSYFPANQRVRLWIGSCG